MSDEQRRKNLFQGSIGGNRSAGKFTLNGMVDQLIPSAISCAVNAAGGACAQFAGDKIDSWKRGWGTIGVSVIAITLKAAVQPVGEVQIAIRELAAGMAGYVGDEILEGFALMWRATSWKPGAQWKRDTYVSYAGEYYVSSEDIPASDSVKPPLEDKRWVPVKTGRRLDLADVKECTRLVFQDKDRVELITSFLASSLGSQRGWTEQEVADTKKSLSSAMEKVATEIQKL